jgi:predicted lysophospholipase L1 biosynthesis ABC-type transport system permease subunit
MLDQPSLQIGTDVDFLAMIGTVMVRFDTEQITSIKAHLDSTGSLPREVDAPLLAQARHTLGADLNTEQKRQLRPEAQAYVRDRGN